MPNTPPTVRTIALRLLRDLGVISLNPSAPANQPTPLESTDLDDVTGVMSAALQEIYDEGPSELKEQNLSGYLNAPTNTTLSATLGSTTISSLSVPGSWVGATGGCTIRIAGDAQDNELTSATQLARPYMGATGSGISATLYGDSLQLDDSINKVMHPVSLPNQVPLWAATDRLMFLRLAGYPLVTNADGSAYGAPFFWFVRKNISRPLTWFLEGAANSALWYLPRRIRVAPMPDQAYALGYRAAINPPRFAPTDVDTGDHTTDPGTNIPIPNGFIETIYLPICRQRLSGLAQFKNQGTLPEIGRAYKAAVAALKNSRGQSALTEGRYL